MPGPFAFAWSGGAIEEQLTLTTNGTTHGARPVRAAIVGDISSGGQQLTNLASSEGLEAGSLYAVEGAGLPAGTLFIFDDSVLSGLPGSLNLSHLATAAHQSATFQTTKADPVGTLLGTLSQGSSSVTLSGAGSLPPGIYAIQGTGIGETDVPLNTTQGTTVITGGGIMTISTAFLNYAGGGIGTMYIYGASSHTRPGFDPMGQPTNIITYTVGTQAVRATTSGQFPVLITGFPPGDPFVVDGIPSGALMSLTPGLTYNVTGNGIQVGTTFIAPSGGTSIDLDLPATASDINAILTITGPRTPNAPFDPIVHNRFDEDVLSVQIAQEEGGFATLTVEIKNPGVGLLATGRYLWCWLSWDQAWTPDGGAAADLVPLFNGRLVGVPKLQAGEVVQLEFLARPDDFNAQKLARVSDLAVLPYYDPVWFNTNLNADTVLETYSALWHIDRVDLSVTASDILEGEDGLIDIGEDQALYEHFSLAYGQPPLVATTVTGTVEWSQQGDGIIDVTQSIIHAFHESGSYYGNTFGRTPYGAGGGGLIQVLCGDGLKQEWPRPGTSIGGGWTLTTLNDHSGIPLCYIVDATWLGTQTYYNVVYEGMTPPPSQAGNTTDQSNVNIFLHPFGTFAAAFPLNVYKIRMNLEYKAARRRTETVTAVVMAGVQRELSDSAENDRETISLTSQYVGQAVDFDGTIPIGNVGYRSYFQTARGASSFEYLLLAARAKMRARARAVDVTFAVGWRDALNITLRNSVHLTDYRLPGGSAVGKVKSYKLSCSGGTMLGEFTIGCSIGTGDGVTPQPGVPVYVDAGYVNPGYQVMTGEQIPLGLAGDVAYQTLDDFAIADDGLDLTHLTADTAVNECVVTNGMTIQLPYLQRFQGALVPAPGTPISTMDTITTSVTLDMKPVQGSEFHTEFFPAVTPLMLPLTIDLSAPAPGA